MGRTLHGRARLLTGDQAGIGEMTDGLQGAIASGNHVFVMMNYVLMAQDYWDLGRFDQVDRFVQEGLSYTSEREVDFYAGHLRAHQARLTSLRGNWAAAEGILRELVGVRGGREPGTLRYALPALAVIATRRDTDDAAELLDWSLDFARRAGGYYDTIPAAFAELEAAWLTGRPELARAPPQGFSRSTAPDCSPAIAANCSAGCAGWACPPRSSRAAPRCSPPASGAIGEPRPPSGRGSAPRTTGPWSWWIPVRRIRRWRRCRSSTRSGRRERCRSPGAGYGNWASPSSRAARSRRRERTRPG